MAHGRRGMIDAIHSVAHRAARDGAARAVDWGHELGLVGNRTFLGALDAVLGVMDTTRYQAAAMDSQLSDHRALWAIRDRMQGRAAGAS